MPNKPAETEPPQPKVGFAVTPAKPKGTIADALAGNLPPPEQPRPSRQRRRAPNPKRDPETEELRRQVRIKEQIEAPPQGQPPAWARVIDDLLYRRKQIDAAISALKELYGD